MTENAIDVGDRKQLFIDEVWFAAGRGMSLCVNPPVKAERVLVPKTPWETKGIHAYSTVIEDDGLYRMWYDAIAAGDKPHSRCLCYATSEDGIFWERQNVNLFEWEGIRENSIVMPGTCGGVMLDPNGPHEQRFKALCIIKENDVWPESKGCISGVYDGVHFMELYLCTSPDGIHWTRHEPSALPFFHDTHNMFFYDPRLRKYVACVRMHEAGRTVGRLEFDDPMQLPWPYRRVAGTRRGPGRSQRDGQGALELAITRDESDPPDTDIYTPSVVRYPWADNSYFSFTTPYRHYPCHGDQEDTALEGSDERGRYRNDGCVEVQLAVSRDGRHWLRPDRRPYVPLGLKGAWDAGQVYMGLGMIRRGAEIWQYYSGTHHTHGAYDPNEEDRAGGVCRLVQRLDGFVSADAEYTGAQFTTPLIMFSGPSLQLNVDCSAMGEVWVEIRDERGLPIPGYTMDEAISIDRNQIAAPVRWRQREDAGELIDRPVRLHLRLRACKLYAFQFASEEDRA